MITSDPRIEFELKRIPGIEDLKDRWFERHESAGRYLFERLWPTQGVFGVIAMSAAGADQFALTTDVDTADGAGHALATLAALVAATKFENALGIDYYVGLKWAERPRGIQVNPRTGMPNFDFWEETIGESGSPDSVAVSGGGLRIDIDSLLEAGHSYAGRSVVVWKRVPGRYAVTEAIAVETLTSQWDGSNFVVSAAQFGQSTPSTNPADYCAVVLGPSVRRDTDLRLSAVHTFVGIVTGVGAGSPPAAFDTSDQVSLFSNFSSLNDVVEAGPGGHLKIRVRSYAGDGTYAQIQVKNPAGVSTFNVDKDGNVNILGNLDVTGTTTEHNVETVYSDETVTGNLTAGDTATDVHTFKGTVNHYVGAVRYFHIDGASGRIGLCGDAHGAYATWQHGSMLVTGDLHPGADGNYNLGAPGVRWKNLYVINLVFSGDFLPLTDNTQDIGSGALRWAEGYFGTKLVVSGTVGSDLIPTLPTNTWDLGSTSNRWMQGWISQITCSQCVSDALSPSFGFYASGGNPYFEWDSGDRTYYNRTNNTYFWDIATGAVMALDATNLTVRNVLPWATNTYVCGSLSYRWASVTASALQAWDNTGAGPWQIVKSGNFLELRANGTYKVGFGGFGATDSTVQMNCTLSGALASGEYMAAKTYYTVSATGTSNFIQGYRNDIAITTAGTLTAPVAGYMARIGVSASSTLVGSVYGYWSRLDGTAGATISNYYAYYAEASSGAGTITADYVAFYAPNPTGWTIGDKYGIVAGTDFDNIFYGHVGIGATVATSANQRLYVRSGIDSTIPVVSFVRTATSTDGEINFLLRSTLASISFTGKPAYINTDNLLHLATGGTARMRIYSDGRVTTGSAGVPGCATAGGLTIRPDAATTNHFTTQYAGLNNGWTGFAPNVETYWMVQPLQPAANGGGLDQTVYMDTVSLIYRVNAYTNAAASTSTGSSSTGHFLFDGYTSSATKGNLFAIQQDHSTVLLVKYNGDIVILASTNPYGSGNVNVRYFDDEKDAAACQDLAYAMEGGWDRVVEYTERKLEEMGILQNGFLSYKRALALQLGAIGELHQVVGHLAKMLGLEYEDIRKLVRAKQLALAAERS